ncbi:hypothetical protein CMALT430_320022 [Carnobacterium maltaromaticum]|nr:hypothetical protein CMALT430_320022 [Carnobacterium maltaromaticum]
MESIFANADSMLFSILYYTDFTQKLIFAPVSFRICQIKLKTYAI